MKCEKIKELLLTDYIDGEMNADLREEINQHLKTCQECKRFLEEFQQAVVEPLRREGEVTPSPSLWYRIKETIESEQRRAYRNPLQDILDKLRWIIYFPKPVFVTAIGIILILVVTLVMRPFLSTQQEVAQYLEEQAEFLTSLEVNGESVFNGSSDGFGTPIEEYFL